MKETRRHTGEETLTEAQLRHHYEVEKALANRLRAASKAERRNLYSALYNELYREVPFHPQLSRKKSQAQLDKASSRHLQILQRFLRDDTSFLEIGPGDCALAFRVAGLVRQVYAVDVSDEITKTAAAPENFRLFLSDGSSIPVPADSIDVAYSNSLIEHLHPEDVIDQLQNIYAALAMNGVYVCVTPNRALGPHDVSRHFDEVATGFHLQEYTLADLDELFRNVGFTKTRVLAGFKRRFFLVPVYPVVALEKFLCWLPRGLRDKLLGFKLTRRLLKGLLGAKLVGVKA